MSDISNATDRQKDDRSGIASSDGTSHDKNALASDNKDRGF